MVHRDLDKEEEELAIKEEAMMVEEFRDRLHYNMREVRSPHQHAHHMRSVYKSNAPHMHTPIWPHPGPAGNS